MGKQIILLAIFSLLLSACASATPSTASAAIEYTRTGGIAGFNDQLKIDAKGHATLKRRNANFEFDLTADELNRLQSSLRDANFNAIPENSMPRQLVPDELSYMVVYQGHTVKTSDTGIPAGLQATLDAFNVIIDTHGK